MNLFCRLGIHIERYSSCNVAGESKCSCGKKHTPPIVWPQHKEAQHNIKINIKKGEEK